MTNDPKTNRIVAALMRLHTVCRSTASTDRERALQVAAYCDGLAGLPIEAIETACRRWPEMDNGHFFPTLAELSKFAARIEHDRQQAAALPPPRAREPGGEKRTLRTSASLRAEYVELMAALKANPEKFVGAAALIAIGEDLMAKAGMVDASARAA